MDIKRTLTVEELAALNTVDNLLEQALKIIGEQKFDLRGAMLSAGSFASSAQGSLSEIFASKYVFGTELTVAQRAEQE